MAHSPYIFFIITANAVLQIYLIIISDGKILKKELYIVLKGANKDMHNTHQTYT